MSLSQDIHYVVGAQGKPTAVLIDIVTWERILQALEDAEDVQLARQTLTAITSAGGDLEKAGLLRWDQVRQELLK